MVGNDWLFDWFVFVMCFVLCCVWVEDVCCELMLVLIDGVMFCVCVVVLCDV